MTRLRTIVTRSIAWLALWLAPSAAAERLSWGQVYVWDLQEIAFEAAREYANPYTEVDCWIELEGPGFARRVRGFWDGGRVFRVRFVATAPGEWRWRAGSNQPADAGLNGGRGNFVAVEWSAEQKAANPNRRGFVRATANGRALEYADGTPFFLTGDTWLAASTWRLPWRGVAAAPEYEPSEGIGFEEAVAWRKRQGFNSVSFIAAFPNWAADARPARFANADGVYLRDAWEKFGHWAARPVENRRRIGTNTAKDMPDEDGNTAFAVLPDRDGLADFDRLQPAYFRNLDRKMKHLAAHGFVPVFEPVRRDCTPAWKAYFDFASSYERYLRYLVARYGAFNLIFSGIHLDWIPPQFSLPGEDFNAVLTRFRERDGPLPFGQPFTTLISSSTYRVFGHAAQCPWLTMHTVGNDPRNHRTYALLEEIFRLEPPLPAANLEPYYAGWNNEVNRPAGELPTPGSERDDYFARAMAYGSVLSGGLAGHVYGTGAYDLTTTGEPAGWRPYVWEALRYRSGGQVRFLREFVLSEGARYRELRLAKDGIVPRATLAAKPDGLDGWSFMMRTPDGALALLYFEHGAEPGRLLGFEPGGRFEWTWFNPRTGSWLPPLAVTADARGEILVPAFPAGGGLAAATDWAAKLTR